MSLRPLPALCLLAVLGAYLSLALGAVRGTPLWESGGEYEHLRLARHLALERSLPAVDDGSPEALAEAGHPPLAHLLLGLGLHLLELDRLAFLARPNLDLSPREPCAYLHGADELEPLAPPVRRLQWLRLLGVTAGALTLLGTFLLARRVVPERPAVAFLAAGLLAVDPAFAAQAAALAPGVIAAALITAALVSLSGLLIVPREAPLPAGRALETGLAAGLASLASPAGWVLPPLAMGALLVARRGPGRARLGELLLGILLPCGPWLAWNTVHTADPLALSSLLAGRVPVPPSQTVFDWLAAFGSHAVGEHGQRVPGGDLLLGAWAVVLAVGGAGLLVRLRRPAGMRRPLAGLLLLATGLLVAGAALAAPAAEDLHVWHLVAALPLLAVLLAAGAGAWLRPAVAGACLAVLLALGLSDQAGALATYWPPNRLDDSHFVAVDVLAAVPESHRPTEVAMLAPVPPDETHPTPELRWVPEPDLDARYTVHLTLPGLSAKLRTYERKGLALRDRYPIPATVWDNLPEGVALRARVLRLPTRAELASTPLEHLFVPVSPVLELYRSAAAAP